MATTYIPEIIYTFVHNTIRYNTKRYKNYRRHELLDSAFEFWFLKQFYNVDFKNIMTDL